MPAEDDKQKKQPDDDEIVVLDGDLNADWIKFVDDGESQRRDLEAHEEATRIHNERIARGEEE